MGDSEFGRGKCATFVLKHHHRTWTQGPGRARVRGFRRWAGWDFARWKMEHYIAHFTPWLA